MFGWLNHSVHSFALSFVCIARQCECVLVSCCCALCIPPSSVSQSVCMRCLLVKFSELLISNVYRRVLDGLSVAFSISFIVVVFALVFSGFSVVVSD